MKQLLLALALLASVLIWWLQPGPEAPPPRTIGVVSLTVVDLATQAGFKAGLADMGYRAGENIRFLDPGPAGRIEELDRIVAAQLASGVDLIFVSSTPATQAVARATHGRDLPVVFAPVNDPVKSDLVGNLRAPGGNLTGIRLPGGDALRLQWLLRVAPQVKHVLLPYNPADSSAIESLRQMQSASRALGLELLPQPVANAAAIAAGLREMPSRVDAILLPRDSLVESHIAEFVAAARARAVPLCVPSLVQVEAGALLSYGFVHAEIGRQAARLVGQVLRGVPPGDLPVEQARNYLVVNLRAARDIGLRVPDDVVRMAHVVLR